jgi:hypothetical protein
VRAVRCVRTAVLTLVQLHAIAAAGASFLTAVLWFDLMFDVQTRRHAGQTLPEEVLASISAYYRRVTTDATPMNRLVSIVMLATLGALVAQIVDGGESAWIAGCSLALAASGIGLAGARTVRNAVRLGSAVDAAARQSQLARSIYRDHLFCLAVMASVVAIQLSTIHAQ